MQIFCWSYLVIKSVGKTEVQQEYCCLIAERCNLELLSLHPPQGVLINNVWYSLSLDRP